MKNYDIKLLAMDLSNVSDIRVSGKRLAFLVPNMFNKITSGYSKKTSAYLLEHPELVKQEEVVTKVTTPEVTSPITTPEVNNTPVVKEEEAITPAVVKEKAYALKILPADFEFLKTKSFTVTSPARKLLISLVFAEKLLSNRSKHIKVEEQIVPTITPVEVESVDPVLMGVKKYVELMSKRKSLIAEKQACEKEMTDLVNEFGITLDMVNAQIAKEQK